jgi:hypothetical protein
MSRKSRNQSFFKELLSFFIEHKAWWIAPIILILLLVGILIIVGQSNSVSPFIYALF